MDHDFNFATLVPITESATQSLIPHDFHRHVKDSCYPKHPAARVASTARLSDQGLSFSVVKVRGCLDNRLPQAGQGDSPWYCHNRGCLVPASLPFNSMTLHQTLLLRHWLISRGQLGQTLWACNGCGVSIVLTAGYTCLQRRPPPRISLTSS